MKKLILIAITLIIGFSSIAHAERPFVVVAEDWAPFEFKAKDGTIQGIDVDIANNIFAKLGITPKYMVLPWDTAWKMAEEGRSDAIFSTSRKEVRKPVLYYPKENMWTGEFVFFVNKKNKKASFTSYADAKGLSVAVVKGNSYSDEFMNAGLKLVEVKTLKKQLRRLASGKVDLAMMEKKVGLYTSKLLNMQSTIDYYDHVFYSKGYPMPFAKKSTYPGIKEISEKFEAELVKMKASGEYQTITDKWTK